jgi:hypothetical protein
MSLRRDLSGTIPISKVENIAGLHSLYLYRRVYNHIDRLTLIRAAENAKGSPVDKSMYQILRAILVDPTFGRLGG